MSRDNRIDFEGAVFHVVQRGNNQEYVFESDDDKSFFRGLAHQVAQETGIRLFAYSIMDNHVHMGLVSERGNLGVFMKRLTGPYAQRYNYIYERTGHVFQDRYRAFLIEDYRYLLSVIRYIHLNPVKAKLVEHTPEYKWSSDMEYRTGNNYFVDSEFVLRMISGDIEKARQAYCRLVDGPDPIADLTPWVTRKFDRYYLGMLEAPQRRPLTELLATAIPDEAIRRDALVGVRRQEVVDARRAFIQSAISRGYTRSAVASFLNISPAAVTNLLK